MGGGPSEAEVVYWLKRGLLKEGLDGRAVREVVVDADPAYLRSPYRRQLEPTGTIRIGGRKPDLVCTYDAGGSEWLAGFEVKAASEHEKGVVQATRYREGVHQAFLCIPRTERPTPDWLRRSASAAGVGLLRAAPGALLLDVAPPGP